MDVQKLYLILRYGVHWVSKWIDIKNIEAWEEFEQEIQPGETIKDYRQRLDGVARKANELRERSK